MRLTLLLWRQERFDLRASDALGRGLWSVAVDGDLGLWSDLREKQSCRFAARSGVRIGGVELSLASSALPSVLLGQLPTAIPQDLPSGGGDEQEMEFDDSDGRRWWVRLSANGRLESWELSGAEGPGRLRWERLGRDARLQSGEPEFQFVWHEVARAELAEPESDLGADAWNLLECEGGFLP